MALSDRKVPIITGINDVPSESGDAKHPNASLLCSSYNALIDDLTTQLDALDAPTGYYADTVCYVDLASGSDSNDGLTVTTPFRTMDKAMALVAERKILFATIKVKGTLTNYSFDLSRFYPSATNYDWYRWGTGESIIELSPWDGAEGGTLGDFVIHTDHAKAGTDNVKPLVYGSDKIVLRFNTTSFTYSETSEPIYIENVAVTFIGCTFTEPTTSNLTDGFIFATKCSIGIQDITLVGTASGAGAFIAGYLNHISTQGDTAYGNYNVVDGTDNVIAVQATDTAATGKGKYSTRRSSIYSEAVGFGAKELIKEARVPPYSNLVISDNGLFLPHGRMITNTLPQTNGDNGGGIINGTSANVLPAVRASYGIKLPANTAVGIVFPTYTRTAQISMAVMRKDTGLAAAYSRWSNNLAIISDDKWATVGGAGAFALVGEYTTDGFMDQQNWSANAFPSHDPANNNTNKLHFTAINNGTGLCGVSFDNCFAMDMWITFEGLFTVDV